jgi:hypothetical protein
MIGRENMRKFSDCPSPLLGQTPVIKIDGYTLFGEADFNYIIAAQIYSSDRVQELIAILCRD